MYSGPSGFLCRCSQLTLPWCTPGQCCGSRRLLTGFGSGSDLRVRIPLWIRIRLLNNKKGIVLNSQFFFLNIRPPSRPHFLLLLVLLLLLLVLLLLVLFVLLVVLPPPPRPLLLLLVLYYCISAFTTTSRPTTPTPATQMRKLARKFCSSTFFSTFLCACCINLPFFSL